MDPLLNSVSTADHYHSPPVRAFNEQALTQPAIDLSEHGLLAMARAATGLTSLGDESFLPALRTLLDSAQREAQLNAFGRQVLQGRTLASLKNRLWAEASFAVHPEIRRRRLAAPIVIIGPHRSGTTRLHSMMATDPALRHLKTWEGINPAPRMGLPDAGRATRYEEVRQALEKRDAIYPGAYQAHAMHADWPEEEMLLLNHSFCGFSPLGLYHVPSYYQWFMQADKLAAYRYMADLMRLIEWSAGEPEGRRWVLKNPQHMLDLDTLLTVFPDATLIFIHRDPQKTVASVMSLMWTYAVQHTDAPCRAWIRDIWLDFCEQSARRCIAARGRWSAVRQIDVHYAEMNQDWRGVMANIYAQSGLDWTSDVERAMAAWLARSAEESRQGQHRYAAEDFGVSYAMIEASMACLREHYSVAYE